jgi:hypothetical protein
MQPAISSNKLLSTLFSATMGQNNSEYNTKSTKNSQFIVKITKNYHYGPISQKVRYTIFYNIPFWKAPMVPSNIPPEPGSLENSP